MAIEANNDDFGFLGAASMPPSAAEEADGISIGEIIATLWRRRVVLMSVAVGLTLLGFVVVKLLTPSFSATAILILNQQPDSVLSLEPAYLHMGDSDAVTRSQSDAIQSRTLIDRVVDREGLMDDPEFNPYAQAFQPNLLTRLGIAQRLPHVLQPYVLSKPLDPSMLTPAQIKYRVATMVLKSLDVEPDTKTYTVKINFSSVDSEKAARIANAFAQEYLNTQMDEHAEYSDFAAKWLDDKLATLSKKVQESGTAVAKFRADNHIVNYPGAQAEGNTLALQQVQNIAQQLSDARSKRTELEAQEQALQQLASNPNSALSAPAVAQAPAVENLRNQVVTAAAHLAELRGIYGTQHPLVLAAQGSLNDLQRQLQGAVQIAVAQLSTQLRQARGNESQAQAQLDTLSQARDKEASLMPRLQQLEAEQAAAVAAYNTFSQGYYHATMQDGVPTAKGHIVQVADPLDYPSYPNTLIFMAVIAIASGMIAVATVYILESRDKSFHSIRQLEADTGVPVLGITLRAPRERITFTRLARLTRSLDDSQPVSERMLTQPNSSLSETVRLVRTAITFSHVSRPPKIIMVTSAVPGEGKTTFTMMMARLSAVSGKRVLVIEAEMRRPCFARELNSNLPKKGLTDYLLGEATIDEVIGVDKASGAHFIAVRKPVQHPGDLLASARMSELLDEAAKRYDLVVLDTPPATIVSDALELGRGQAIDAAVLLVKWASTPAHLVVDAARKLRAINVPLAGTVLTQVDPKRYSSYGGGRLAYQYGKNYYSGT